jgi:myo-inositol-1(or 4)-monophosphatase
VASGRLDGYFAACVQIWDVAAGVLLVSEAGGIITDLDGGPFDLYRPKFVAAATEPLQRELRAAVLSVGGEP